MKNKHIIKTKPKEAHHTVEVQCQTNTKARNFKGENHNKLNILLSFSEMKKLATDQ